MHYFKQKILIALGVGAGAKKEQGGYKKKQAPHILHNGYYTPPMWQL